MKTLLAIFTAIAVCTTFSFAEDAKPAETKPKQEFGAGVKAAETATTQAKPQLQTTAPLVLKPNQMETKHGVVSGVFIHALKTDNPLQLINPFAPARYGNSYDNTAIDPITGRSIGIKAVSFQF